MKVLIVEDETAAFENLAEILCEVEPSAVIAANTESISQTIKWLEKNPLPDLILMDIHLSDGSAFAIFDQVKLEVPVIFTTAYDEYAINAFKVNSIDYLLKPVKKEELNCAIEKFKRLSQNELVKYLSKLGSLASKPKYKDKILVPVKDKLQPVSMDEISFFYTTEKSTRVYLKNGSSLPLSKTLDQIEATLDPEEFTRANKQFIVARNCVKNITIWFDSRLLLTLDPEPPERIYVSKNKASEFKTWLVKG